MGPLDGNKKKNYNNNIGRFPGGGLENQNPARTIAHSPPGVKETLNYMLREKSPQIAKIPQTVPTTSQNRPKNFISYKPAVDPLKRAGGQLDR